MDMSNFTDTQRDVREAISKACANFSDVSPRCLTHYLKEGLMGPDIESNWIRNIGLLATRRWNIRGSYTQLLPKMVGSVLRYQKIWEERGWVYQKRPS